MIKLLRKLATVMLPAFLCGTLLIGCEADDKYTKVDDPVSYTHLTLPTKLEV